MIKYIMAGLVWAGTAGAGLAVAADTDTAAPKPAAAAAESHGTFETRLEKLQEEMAEKYEKDPDGATAAYDAAVRKLAADFPKHPGAYEVLSLAAAFSEKEKAFELAQKVARSEFAEARIKEQAEGTLRKLERVGQPLAMKFQALDGRSVDLAELKGKVVLIDFWATWCPPCVAAIPELKALYAKHREHGFEIIGLSLDEDREKLEQFVARKKLSWPQRFDGKPWEQSVAPQYGIVGIPSVWLVDRAGLLRFVAPQDGLEQKIEKLLAEK